jgi:hypothetical protein
MPVIIGLLFHANFPFSMHFDVAYHSCYKILPSIMRESPEIPINWHISGPLLQQLKWHHPETLKIIDDGIEDRQFELLGSSYAQNILYTCSDWANDAQINWHKEILNEMFPNLLKISGFWNPERVYYEDLLPLIKKYGYKYTLVESDIIRKGLNSDSSSINHVWKKILKKTKTEFNILPDNQEIKEKMNNVIWNGNNSDFFKYLNDQYSSDSTRNVLCYADDAEVVGFWQYARGMDFKKAHLNLKNLLKAFSENDWIELKLFSDIIKEEIPSKIDNIPHGQATWMVESANVDGYIDWFDYIENSPEISYYKKYHISLEKKFKEIETLQNDRNLAKEIIRFYLTQQYEFGCSPGSFGNLASRYLMNVPGQQLWDDREMIDTLLDLFHIDKRNKKGSVWKFRGSLAKVEWVTKKWISQFNPIGARCTLLINRDYDYIVSPNIFFPSQDRNVINNNFPYLEIELDFPQFQRIMNHHGNLFMDELILNGVPIGSLFTYKVLLNQEGKHYFEKKSLSHSLFNSLILPHKNSVQFWYSEGGIVLLKELKQNDISLELKYKIQNLTESKKKINFHIDNELAPNQTLVLNNGKKCLEENIIRNDSEVKIEIENKKTNMKVIILCKNVPTSIESVPSEFASRHRLTYDFTLDKNKDKTLKFEILD